MTKGTITAQRIDRGMAGVLKSRGTASLRTSARATAWACGRGAVRNIGILLWVRPPCAGLRELRGRLRTSERARADSTPRAGGGSRGRHCKLRGDGSEPGERARKGRRAERRPRSRSGSPKVRHPERSEQPFTSLSVATVSSIGRIEAHLGGTVRGGWSFGAW
jgi:hypothetical protein